MSARAGRIAAKIFFGPEAEQWLSPVIAAAWRGILLVLASSLLAVFLGLATPWVTKQFIDQGLVAGNREAIWYWAAISFAVGLLALLMGIGNALLHLRFSVRMLADLRGRAIRAALARNPLAPVPPVGELMARIDGDTSEIQRFAFDSLLATFGSVLRLVGGAFMLALLEWRLALIPVLAAPVELAFLAWARRRTQARAEEAREIRGQISGYLIESLSTLPVLRSIAGAGRRARGFDPLQSRQIEVLERQRRWLELVSAVPQIIAALVRVAVLVIGGLWVVEGTWQIGSLIAFLAYIGMLTGPLRNLLGLYHAQATVKVAVARLDQVMAGDQAEPDGADLPDGARLDFINARSLPGRHEPIEASIEQGQSVLLDGPSGIGKSALTGLAVRLSPPAPDAKVLLDGVDVSTLDPVKLRRAIALLPQNGRLLRMSLADNLRIAAPDAKDEALWQVLEVADLAEWLRGEGRGLDMPVEESGGALSGGERQKIALARALLMPFRVLILDEALSEIDTASAERILAALNAQYSDRTRIFIAHSGPAREQNFDQVIPLTPDLRSFSGATPNQREKARQKAV